MCGIAGKAYLFGQSVKEHELLSMNGKILHRGPDDGGIFISEKGNVGLANRRLAIIDLSKNGHQPMSYKGRYWITLNGEIYNFASVRARLEKEGCRFRSKSDTEVVLALYDKYKEKCLEHLRGMFAFCIYDSKENTLFLARDRLGVKPLKYYFREGVFIFASEVKSLLTQKEIEKLPDYEALAKYLLYGYIPSPLTGFEGIKKLEPGHFITVNLDKKSFKVKKYWEVDYSHKKILSEKEWTDEILTLLGESTRLRMVSDVPIGAYLSGGVDSSGIVALMAGLSKKPVKTYTITFKDKAWDESVYASKLAKLYKTDHHELEADQADVRLLPDVTRMFEEPFSDAGNIMSYMVNKMAGKYVSVILNGDGGDENFAGYPNRHLRIKRDVDWQKQLNVIKPGILGALKVAGLIRKSKSTEKAIKFLEKSSLPLYERFLSYNSIFSLKELSGHARGDLKESLSSGIDSEIKNIFENFEGPDMKDAGLKFELMYWLPDDLLAKADLMSMANSVEGRSPFLDYKFVEMASSIPFDLKVKKGESKYILKKAFEKIVPKENLYREKRGFGVPLHKWFNGKFNSSARKTLMDKKGFLYKNFDTELVDHMLKTHSETNDFGPKLFSLLTLELWYREYFG